MTTRLGYSQIKGLPFKKPCRVATTSNIANLSSGAPSSVDGVSLSIGDRVLVKSQSTSTQNGIYRVVTVGTGSNGSWVRDYDFSNNVDIYDGVGVFITSGTVNSNSLYYLTTPDPINVGSTSLTFSEFSGGGVSGGATGFGAYWTTSSHIGSMNIFVTASGDVRYIDFDTNVTNDTQLGRLSWNANDGTLNVGLDNGVTLQTGQEQHYYVKNQTGTTLLDGRVVSAAGTLGSSGRILVTYSIADGSVDSHYVMGVLTQTLTTGSDGYVTEFGLVRGIDTTGTPFGETWNDGDVLWVSPTIPGGMTKVRPEAPNQKTIIAIVVHANANGSLFVRPTYGSNLGSDEQVEYNINNLVDNSLLAWNNTNNRWEQATFSNLLALNNGITGSGTTNYVPRWITSSNISSTSSIYDNGTQVGIGLTSTSARLHVSAVTGPTGSTVVKVDGNSGELFTVVDNLVGSLFSVNDISGLPVLEVFSDNTTLIGSYLAPSLYTTKKTTIGTSSVDIYSFATASYDGAFVDYTIKNGANSRSGSIMVNWNSSSIQFTENSTIDIGNTTGFTFSFVISGSSAVLRGIGSTTGWTVKTIIRSI